MPQVLVDCVNENISFRKTKIFFFLYFNLFGMFFLSGVYSANAVACKLKQRALPGDRVASALDTVLLCHELVAWGEVLGLYVDHAQASLLDHMLAELRVVNSI